MRELHAAGNSRRMGRAAPSAAKPIDGLFAPINLLSRLEFRTILAFELRDIRKDTAALIPGPVPQGAGFRASGGADGRSIRISGRIRPSRPIHGARGAKVQREPCFRAGWDYSARTVGTAICYPHAQVKGIHLCGGNPAFWATVVPLGKERDRDFYCETGCKV